MNLCIQNSVSLWLRFACLLCYIAWLDLIFLMKRNKNSETLKIEERARWRVLGVYLLGVYCLGSIFPMRADNRSKGEWKWNTTTSIKKVWYDHITITVIQQGQSRTSLAGKVHVLCSRTFVLEPCLRFENRKRIKWEVIHALHYVASWSSRLHRPEGSWPADILRAESSTML